jgi:hypothetical protein
MSFLERFKKTDKKNTKSTLRRPGSGISKNRKETIFDKLKPTSKSSKKQSEERFKSRFASSRGDLEKFKRQSQQSQPKYAKTFKPNPDYFAKQASGVKDTSKQTSKTDSRVGVARFSAFNPSNFLQSLAFRFWPGRSKWTVNRMVLQERFFRWFNRLVGQGLLLSIFLGFIYISFFDRYFLVKTYTFSFADSSYLSSQELDLLSDHFSSQSTFGFLPENQYWYLNERNLTLSANEVIPEINTISVKSRTWPDQVELKIDTEPILATLAVTENRRQKYWRISQQGRVVTEDIAGLREKLIEVKRPILFDTNDVTFKSYALQREYDQVNRLWFANWLWRLLETGEDNLGLTIRHTYFPSLVDTDVVMVTDQGTELWFESDIDQIARENQEARIRAILNSQVYTSLQRGEVAYIDFRIPLQKVFVCYRGQSCAG